MPRTKGGPKTRHRRKAVLKLAKGYWGARRKLYAVARETVDRALAYAFAGRKQKKRQYRRVWIVRLNAALRPLGVSYSRFIHGLKLANIDLDRRVLADMALHDPAAFGAVAAVAKEHL
jgi:large subunit ribosomal protein L20